MIEWTLDTHACTPPFYLIQFFLNSFIYLSITSLCQHFPFNEVQIPLLSSVSLLRQPEFIYQHISAVISSSPSLLLNIIPTNTKVYSGYHNKLLLYDIDDMKGLRTGCRRDIITLCISLSLILISLLLSISYFFIIIIINFFVLLSLILHFVIVILIIIML